MACQRPQDRLLLRLAYGYGLRATEVATLTMADFDLERGLVEISRLKGSQSGTMPLLTELRADLAAWLEVRPQSRFLFPAPADPTKSYSRWNVHRVFREAAARAGLDRQLQHPHVLKHSIATHLLENGANIRAAQKWLGLKSVEMIGIYAEVTGTMEEKTTDIARSLLRPQRKKKE